MIGKVLCYTRFAAELCIGGKAVRLLRVQGLDCGHLGGYQGK
jgi:hypothetical protein